jgi:D-serine deaminase-like pyridoxal phosphate-dependent protein
MLTVFFSIAYVLPVVLAVAVGPPLILLVVCSVLVTLGIAGICADAGFYPFPITYELRALNAKHRAEREAWALSRQATRCRELAKTYRDRDQPYDAEILEVESDHKTRKSQLRDEDAERIQREIEDREMLELTKSGR